MKVGCQIVKDGTGQSCRALPTGPSLELRSMLRARVHPGKRAVPWCAIPVRLRAYEVATAREGGAGGALLTAFLHNSCMPYLWIQVAGCMIPDG